MARGYIALMEEVAEHGEPEPMLPAHAAAILGALANANLSRRKMRQIVNRLGYGGGSRDLDIAIGQAMQTLGSWPPQKQGNNHTHDCI